MSASKLALIVLLVSLGSVFAHPDDKKTACKPAQPAGKYYRALWVTNDLWFDDDHKRKDSCECDYLLQVWIVEEGSDKAKKLDSVAPRTSKLVEIEKKFVIMYLMMEHIFFRAWTFQQVEANYKEDGAGLRPEYIMYVFEGKCGDRQYKMTQAYHKKDEGPKYKIKDSKAR